MEHLFRNLKASSVRVRKNKRYTILSKKERTKNGSKNE
jgi:hypothetical protein